MAFEMASCGNGGGTGSTGCDRRRLAEPPNGSGGTEGMPGLDVTGSGGFGGRLRVNRRWNIGHRSYLQRDDACLREPHAVVRGALARPGEFLLAFPLGALVREVVGESLELLPQPVGLELRLPQALSLPRGHGVGPVGEPAANAVEGCGRWGVGCEPRGVRCFKNLPALGSSERADKKRSSIITQQRAKPRDVTVCQ